MASLIVLKRRIASIRNTRQITKAMEMVSSSKLRRAQNAAQMSRPYREAATALLARLGTIKEVELQPLFTRRQVKGRLYIVITSNTGLAGAYNANVLKLLGHAIADDQKNHVKSKILTIGNKGAQFTRRVADVELVAHYGAFGDQPDEQQIEPILQYAVNAYLEHEIDEVVIVFTEFVSSISQVATSLQLLPARAPESIPDGQSVLNFEPDIETVIAEAGVRLVKAEIWQAVLESLASEHAMRALAMKNATDNATDLISDYTLEYNTARQGAITQEIAEISGGAEAMAS